MRQVLLAACAALPLIAPAHAADDAFVLASIYEDQFFETPNLTLDAAADIIVPAMPKDACNKAAKLLANYGAIVACVPRPKGLTDECLWAQVKPTDSNIEACYGEAIMAASREAE